MKYTYPFLKDELALKEIRKHKWLESEKRGQKIGFATAALDWVKKYGPTWLQYRKTLTSGGSTLLRKRRASVSKIDIKAAAGSSR